jgi:hypothetical protein
MSIVAICDVCLLPPRGLPMMAFQVGGSVFHVCSVCEWKPWRVPKPLHMTVTIRHAEAAGVEVFVSKTSGDPANHGPEVR